MSGYKIEDIIGNFHSYFYIKYWSSIDYGLDPIAIPRDQSLLKGDIKC